MELKKGMYVKYTRGMINGYVPPRIAKIVDCSDNDLVAISNSQVILKSDVIKASDNLIDLIEEGDYVNGYMVLEVTEQYIKLNNPKLNHDVIEYERILKNKYSNMAIRDVVTKEQFENMMYIVESE